MQPHARALKNHLDEMEKQWREAVAEGMVGAVSSQTKTSAWCFWWLWLLLPLHKYHAKK